MEEPQPANGLAQLAGWIDARRGDDPVERQLRIDGAGQVEVVGRHLGPGPGAEASTDQTSMIDWFQNSIDQNAFEPPSDWPMYIVRARPVAWSIQSGGVGSTPRSESENEFDAFAADDLARQVPADDRQRRAALPRGNARRRSAPRRAGDLPQRHQHDRADQDPEAAAGERRSS